MCGHLEPTSASWPSSFSCIASPFWPAVRSAKSERCRLSEDLRVTALSPYPFHMADQARQLYQAGVLERMVTAVPRKRVGLPSEVVSTRLRWSGFRYVASRALPRADPLLNREVVRDFDRWAACQLGEPSVVSAMSGFSTGTLARHRPVVSPRSATAARGTYSSNSVS